MKAVTIPNHMTRTLLVYLHGIGDNIMLSGALKKYSLFHSDEIIDIVVLNEGCAAIWRNNPNLSSVIIYPFKQPHFWNTVRFYLMDQWKVRSYIRQLNRDGRYEKILFPTIQTIPEIFYHWTGTYGRHKIDRLCNDLKVAKHLYPYDLYTTEKETVQARQIVSELGGKQFAVIHPFSGHRQKQFDPESVSLVLEALQEKKVAALVVGGRNEECQFNPKWNAKSAFGLSFGVLIEVLKLAHAFVGTDSTVAHLAAFANTPRIFVRSPKLKPSRYLPISLRSQVEIIHVKLGCKHRSLSELRRLLKSL